MSECSFKYHVCVFLQTYVAALTKCMGFVIKKMTVLNGVASLIA